MVRIKKPGPPKEELVLTDDQMEMIAQIEAETGVKIKLPKTKPAKESAPALVKDVVVPVPETVPETKVEKPKAL
jgi:hypothetical protein